MAMWLRREGATGDVWFAASPRPGLTTSAIPRSTRLFRRQNVEEYATQMASTSSLRLRYHMLVASCLPKSAHS